MGWSRSIFNALMPKICYMWPLQFTVPSQLSMKSLPRRASHSWAPLSAAKWIACGGKSPPGGKALPHSSERSRNFIVSMMSAFPLGKLENKKGSSTLEISVSFFSPHLLNRVETLQGLFFFFCKGLQVHCLVPGKGRELRCPQVMAVRAEHCFLLNIKREKGGA